MTKSISLPITEPSQVGDARRVAIKLASPLGFNETQLGQLSIVVTEIGTNLYRHARQGEIIFRRLSGSDVTGIEILSLDRGPGINDVAKCLADGYSTTGTAGTGLGSIKRLSSVFDIYSNAEGTVMVSQIWAKVPSERRFCLEIGAVCLPYPGETLCGDAWGAAHLAAEQGITVADGLGHGEHAALASDLAVAAFLESPENSPTQILRKMHGVLRSTRGAAVVVLRVSLQTHKIVYSGIGNVSGSFITGTESKSFVSLNGTIGHQAQTFQEFAYLWPASSLVILHTDGLQSKWKLDRYPGLQVRHPSLIAAILYRDFRRDRDDVTVLVIRDISKASSK